MNDINFDDDDEILPPAEEYKGDESNDLLSQASTILEGITGMPLDQMSSKIGEYMNNPSKIGQMVSNLAGEDTVNTLLEAVPPGIRKALASGNMQEAAKQMQKAGLDPRKIQKQVKNFSKINKPTKTIHNVLYVNNARKPKVEIKIIDMGEAKDKISRLLNCSEAIPTVSSRLSVGCWSNDEITIWYNPSIQGKKISRNSNLLGFDSCSPLIISTSRDLTIKELESIEKELQNIILV